MSMIQSTGSPIRNLIMAERLKREHKHCFCQRENPKSTFERIGRHFVTARFCCTCDEEKRSYEPCSV
jgi:hypothetical protein